MEFRQWVERRYRHPVVLVLASPLAEDSCRRSGLDVVQMLRPFSQCTTDLFAHIGDRAEAAQLRNFGVRLARLPCVREVAAAQLRRHVRHLVRDHAAVELAYGEQIDRAVSSLLNNNGGVVSEPRVSSRTAAQLLERSHPAWHSQFIHDYTHLVRCSYFDTIDHPVGCMYVASTRETGGIDGIMREYREQQKKPAETRRDMPCMDDDLHSYYLLLHDVTNGPSMEEVQHMFSAVQSFFGVSYCALVKINSVVNPQDMKNMNPSLWIDADVAAMDVPSWLAVRAAQLQQQQKQQHTGDNNPTMDGGIQSKGSRMEGSTQFNSPNMGADSVRTSGTNADSSSEPNSNSHSSLPASLQFPRVHTRFGNWPNGAAKITGCHMSPENVEDLRRVMHHYLSRCLLTFIERKLRALLFSINEKRTTTFGKVAAWFRNKDETKPRHESWVVDRNGAQTKYLSQSLEMQTRRAADFILALGDYDMAASYYKICRNELVSTLSSREFNRPLIAACQEALGVCDLLQGRLPLPSLTPWMTGGTASKSSGDCRLETAFNDYVECRVDTHAFRLSLLLYEYARTRVPPALDRAAACLLNVQRVGIISNNKLSSAVLHELLAGIVLFRNSPYPAGMSIPASIPNDFLLRSHIRQYARHVIIAGSAYLDENLFESALRCYLRALRILSGAGSHGNWQLIFEHLHTLLSYMYRKLGNQTRSIAMAAIAVSMGTSMYSNKRTGLQNFDAFWTRLQHVMEQLGYTLCPHMVVPCVVQGSIRVSVNMFHCDEVTQQESQIVSGEVAEIEWRKMEDALRSHYGKNKVFFSLYHYRNRRGGGEEEGQQLGGRKKQMQQGSDKEGGGGSGGSCSRSSSSMRRYSMHLSEPLEITVTLRNPIGGTLKAEKLCLLYVSKEKPDQLWKSYSSQTVELLSGESKSVTLSFSPSEEGMYVIIGFCWTLMGLEGYYYFSTQSHNNNNNENDNDNNEKDNNDNYKYSNAFEYAIENPVPNVDSPENMEIEVRPPQAWITAHFEPRLPSAMRDGEYYQTSLVLTNGSSHRPARNITLQRSSKNSHIVWFERFGLECNVDVNATFVLAGEELAPKASIALPMTVQAHHSHDSSSSCRNNIFFLVGYTSEVSKEEIATLSSSPVASASQSSLCIMAASPPTLSTSSLCVRFHRLLRRVVVKPTILISSMVLPPANASMASAVVVTVSNVSDARGPPVRISRVMVVHRPRWTIPPPYLGSLLAENALECILSSGGAVCIPINVVSETPPPQGEEEGVKKLAVSNVTAAQSTASNNNNNNNSIIPGMVEDVCIPLLSTILLPTKRRLVEANIGTSVVKSAMNTYFMRCGFRGPGVIGGVEVRDGLPFYLDKAGGAGGGKNDESGKGEEQQQTGGHHRYYHSCQYHPHASASVVEPFTPICVAVVWTVEEADGRMYSGQVFHFVDPVHFLSSCESSVAEAHAMLQEHLCASMIGGSTVLHPRHGAVFYYLQVPDVVTYAADSQETVMIPVTMHCRSLAAYPLLVTVRAMTPGSDKAVKSASLSCSSSYSSSSIPAMYVGKTSCVFLILPHENHSVNFTACASAPGLVECNLFKVHAVALKLPVVGKTNLWKTGMSRGALLATLEQNASDFNLIPSMKAARKQSSSSGGGGGGGGGVGGTRRIPASTDNYDTIDGKNHFGYIEALICDNNQTIALGHGTAAMTRVVFDATAASVNNNTRARSVPTLSSEMKAHHEEGDLYERKYKEFERKIALLNTSSEASEISRDLLQLYPPRARKLIEKTEGNSYDDDNNDDDAGRVDSCASRETTAESCLREQSKHLKNITSIADIILEHGRTSSTSASEEALFEDVPHVGPHGDEQSPENRRLSLGNASSSSSSSSGADTSSSGTQ